MSLQPFAYDRPTTIEETLALLGGAALDAAHQPRPLAGGTDLLTLMKAEVAAPTRLVDLKRVAELSDRIVDGPDGLTLGALATLAEIETDPLVLRFTRPWPKRRRRRRRPSSGTWRRSAATCSSAPAAGTSAPPASPAG